MLGLFKYWGRILAGQPRIITQPGVDAETQARFEAVNEAATDLLYYLRNLSQQHGLNFKFIAEQERDVLRIGTNLEKPGDKLFFKTYFKFNFVTALSVGFVGDETKPQIIFHDQMNDKIYELDSQEDRYEIIARLTNIAKDKTRLHCWGREKEPEFPGYLRMIVGTKLLLRPSAESTQPRVRWPVRRTKPTAG